MADTTSLQRKKKKITLVNETQIRESESASEIYLCFKVIISAPFINVITADSANRRRVILWMSALSFCRRQLPGRMGLFVESQL